MDLTARNHVENKRRLSFQQKMQEESVHRDDQEYATLRSQLERIDTRVKSRFQNSAVKKKVISEMARERSEKSFDKYRENRRTIERQDLNKTTSLLSKIDVQFRNVKKNLASIATRR